MDGLETLRQCEAYARDMERLRVSYQMALEAATRTTPRLDADGGGRSGVSNAPERFAERADWIRRRMDARRAMYAMELDAAADLMELLPPDIADALRLVMIEGDTIRQAAGHMGKSVDGVRYLLRRGRQLAMGVDGLLVSAEYRDMAARYRRRSPMAAPDR